MSNLHEECGVFGIFSPVTTNVASSCYYGLFALQHRGQESCGIVVNDDGLFHTHKDIGIVNDVFTPQILSALGKGKMAIGHVRYGTSGVDSRLEAQPMVVNHVKGRMALAHNGCLTNTYALREKLELEGSIFHSNSDTEVIAYLITKERLTAPTIENAVEAAMNRLEGAYSIVLMSPSKLLAVRDPHGFHPLCYGRTQDGRYVVASESSALDAVDAKLVREIEPGEILIIDDEGARSIKTHCNKVPRSMCVFEYIYFARPDSVIEGQGVHEARCQAGAFLAKSHPVEADVVIGVPDSGLDAAVGYSKESGIPYGIGFLKNKYIGRTFIVPGQESREDRVRIKLNVIKSTVAGKRVVLIDDSIVRGTTCARIIKLLREAGAKEVHMRVTAPPFINPCYYGTDIPSKELLIACHHTLEEIEKIIGVDSLGYLSIEDAKHLAGNISGKGFCTACFDGIYPTAVPTQQKNKFEEKISDNKKKQGGSSK